MQGRTECNALEQCTYLNLIELQIENVLNVTLEREVSMISEKRPYEKPVLEVCVSVSERTLSILGSFNPAGYQPRSRRR